MQNDMLEIAARIRALMEDRGDTQVDLGRHLEIDPTAVSRLLSGHRGLAAGELASLCVRYGVSSDAILFGEQSQAGVGVLLRADEGADPARVVELVEQAFADYRYVRALVGS